ncbi:hypothetical protein ACFY8C_13460 [Streptomyces flavochromogenes]|uniref:Uncharacterized protein n=1 Tax=Streptomyces flavochromogenes TaxID=68199 RepID=A0ABW6XPL8_9ACTN
MIVEHTFDRAGPHFHAGRPKLDPSQSGINFGWDNAPGDFFRYKDTFQKYAAIDKPGGDHHFFYKEGWGTWRIVEMMKSTAQLNCWTPSGDKQWRR